MEERFAAAAADLETDMVERYEGAVFFELQEIEPRRQWQPLMQGLRHHPKCGKIAVARQKRKIASLERVQKLQYLFPMKTIVFIVFATLASAVAQTAPNSFLLQFGTTVKVGDGNIVLNITRSAAPLGVDHIYQLLLLSPAPYYNVNGFFRVLPGFVVQFGINGDPNVSQASTLFLHEAHSLLIPIGSLFSEMGLPNYC